MIKRSSSLSGAQPASLLFFFSSSFCSVSFNVLLLVWLTRFSSSHVICVCVCVFGYDGVRFQWYCYCCGCCVAYMDLGWRVGDSHSCSTHTLMRKHQRLLCVSMCVWDFSSADLASVCGNIGMAWHLWSFTFFLFNYLGLMCCATWLFLGGLH